MFLQNVYQFNMYNISYTLWLHVHFRPETPDASNNESFKII